MNQFYTKAENLAHYEEVGHAALDMQIGSKWLLIPVVGKVWRDVSRLDVWASSMVLPAPPEEVEHHL